MPLSQADRYLRVKLPVADDTFVVTRFAGQEEVSKLSTFEVDLIALSATSIAFDKLLGQPIRIDHDLPGQHQRYFHGIVTRLIQGEDDGTYTHYRIEMAPALWLLTRNVRSRIFAQQTVPEILQTVLKGQQPVLSLGKSYHPRDYVVQYRESDFAFACRLMEAEGIFFYFENSENEQKLLLADDSTAHCSKLPRSSRVPYGKSQRADTLHVRDWQKSQAVCIGKYKVWDHCFQLHGHKSGVQPPENLEATAAIAESVKIGGVEHKLRSVGGNDQLEEYRHDIGFGLFYDAASSAGTNQTQNLQYIFEDNQRLARVHMEEQAARSVDVRGAGQCGHFEAGRVFQLQGHPHADGDYLLTQVQHAVEQAGPHTSNEVPPVATQTRFQCLPASMPFRPARLTPVPRIEGAQTATVVGPSDSTITCATYARVKVQFHWDTDGQHDGKNARWVRVGQQWAGKGYGQLYLPRVGHEVIVSFLDGDPDRPLIVGSVYNEANPPSHTLPDYGHFLVEKTQSLGSSSGHSGTIVSDKTDTVHQHTQSTRLDSVNGDHHYLVGGTSRHVSSKRSKVVGALPSLGSGAGAGGSSSTSETSQWRDFGWSDAENKIEGTGYEVELNVGAQFEAILGVKAEVSFGFVLEFFVDPFALLSIASDTPGLFISYFPHVAKTEMYVGNRTDYYMWGKKYTCVASGETKIALTSDSKVAWIPQLRTLGQTLGRIAAILGLADFILYLECAKDIDKNEYETLAMEAAAELAVGLVAIIEMIPFVASWLIDADALVKKAPAEVVKDKSLTDPERQLATLSSSVQKAENLVKEMSTTLTSMQDLQTPTRLQGSIIDVNARDFEQHSDERSCISVGTTTTSNYACIEVLAGTALQVNQPNDDEVAVDEPVTPGIYMDVGTVGPALRMSSTGAGTSIIGLGIADLTDVGVLPRLIMTEETLTTELWATGSEDEDVGVGITMSADEGIILLAGSTATGPAAYIGDDWVQLLYSDTNSVTLEAAGLTLTFGTATIKLSADGITLSFGDTSIALTAASLKLTMGTTSIALAATGITYTAATQSFSAG